MQAHLRIAFGEREDFATLAQGAIFVVVELYQRPLVGLEAVESRPKGLLLCFAELRQLPIIRKLGQALRAAEVEEREAALSALSAFYGRERRVTGDAVEPGREGTARAIARQVRIGLEEDILCQLLGLLPLSHNADNEGKDRAAVPLD